MKTYILHLEDDARDAELVQAMLESANITCHITLVQTGEEFSEALHHEKFDVILADYRLPAYDGMSALRLAQELRPDVPFIFVSGTMGEDAAIAGLTEGATDYVLKHSLSRLPSAIKRALHDAENKRERKRAEAEVAQRNRDLMLLNKVIAAATSTLDMRHVLTETCRELALAFDVPQAAAALLNAEGTVATVVAEYLAPGRPSAIGIELLIRNNPVSQYVIEHKTPLVVPDAQHDPRLVPVHGVMVERGTASLLILPLMVNNSVIGTIGLDAIQPREFTDQEVKLATSVTAAVSQALTNVYLYQELASYKDILEQRVEERTTKLKIANDQLRCEIAERTQAENIIRERTLQLESANRELQALSRIKDEFVSNVSHELRSPIANLILRQHLLSRYPNQMDKHLAVICRETERLKHTIEDLLYLSRLDQKRIQMNLAPVDLNTFVQEYVEDRGLLARERELTLVFSGQSVLPTVLTDPGLLGQVLSILLTNAINYTPVGGHVVVSTHSGQAEDRTWVGFSVSDDGLGISLEEQSRLFERFFRGEVGLESKVPGTGLGLALAKEIIDRFGGRIEVESEGVPGKGTTFKVWLPVDREDHG